MSLPNGVIPQDIPTVAKDIESIRLTDTSNAELIAKLYGDRLRFDHKRRRWLIWRDHRWQPDLDGSIHRYAISAARKRYSAATGIDDLAQRSAASKWAIQSESKVRVDAAVGLVKNFRPIADTGENWDTNHFLLGCPNGVIDLTTGELRDGMPTDRLTMSITIPYDKAATCPRWLSFINEVFTDDADMVRYIQKALGYTLTGDIREQSVFFGYGSGSNGKSVLFSTIRYVLGDYAHTAPASLFQRNVMQTNSNDLAATEKKRFLMSSESLSSTKLHEQRIKQISGGDSISARYLYAENFEFVPTAKIWLFVNHKPQVEDDSHGFWRRMKLIPFDRVFKVSEQDLTLPEKLRCEAAGILNWLIEGCLLWQKEGLKPVPVKITSATQEYQAENDALAEFIYSVCQEGDGFEVKALELYKAYMAWSEEQGLKGKDVLTNTAFGRRMGDKYIKVVKKNGAYYRGIEVAKGGGLLPSFTREVVGYTPISIKSSYEDDLKKVYKNDPQPTIQDQNHLEPTTQDQDLEPEEVAQLLGGRILHEQ